MVVVFFDVIGLIYDVNGSLGCGACELATFLCL